MSDPIICVVIPAYNEERSISQTVADYRSHFPNAVIVVVDNNSTDQTALCAESALAGGSGLLLTEKRKGKGAAVKTGLSRIDADIYIMTDGDGTYPASDARHLVSLLENNRCDMVVGDRQAGGTYRDQNTRPGHSTGNRLLSKYVSSLSGQQYNDVLSGLRVMSRPFVASLDVRSTGFQLETELNIVAAYLRANVIEAPVNYLSRVEGDKSKLNTIDDGLRILFFALINWLAFYPLRAFGILAAISLAISAVLGAWVFYVFFKTGLMPYPSTAVATAVVGLVGIQSMFSGVNLHIAGRNARRAAIAALLEKRRSWNQKMDLPNA